MCQECYVALLTAQHVVHSAPRKNISHLYMDKYNHGSNATGRRLDMQLELVKVPSPERTLFNQIVILSSRKSYILCIYKAILFGNNSNTNM
jgi:hypothetical protein